MCSLLWSELDRSQENRYRLHDGEINVVSTDKRRMGIDFISSLKQLNCYGNITKMVLKARLSHGDLTIQQPSVCNVGTLICSSTNARPFVAEHVHGIATALSRFKFVLSS